MSAPSETSPRVFVVLLNYNAWEKTLSCLDSIEASTVKPDAVVLLDNASQDDRSEHILARHPRVAFIRNPENLGFAKGVNVGIRHALECGADYIWLLNNDTTVVPEALASMMERMRQSADIAIVGGQLRESSGRQRVQSMGGGRVNRWLGLVHHCKSPACMERIDYVNGADMLIRCRALKEVGLFDEGYFMYWEDVDLGLRMRHAGWQLAVAPDAIVYHEVSGTIGRTSGARRRLYLASAKRFLRRYAPFSPLAISACWSVQMLLALKSRNWFTPGT